jgi:dipeptidyl aminopeptidase/acylaminoacyl peptidase
MSSLSAMIRGALLLSGLLSAFSLTAQTAPLSVEDAVKEVLIGRYDPPALSPDGRLLAYSTITWPPPVSITRLTGASEVDVFPNGMLSRFVGARLHISQMPGGQPRDVTPEGGHAWSPSFSPDSRRLAFYSDADGVPQLWVTALEDQPQVRRISDARVFVKPWSGRDGPVWTADGRRILIITVEEVVPEAGSGGWDEPAVEVSLTGSEQRAATGVDAPSRIPLRPGTVTRAKIQVVDVETAEHRTVVATDAEAQPHAIALSPSARWVAYLSRRALYDPSIFTLSIADIESGRVMDIGEIDRLEYNGPGSTDIYGGGWHWSPTEDRLIFVRDSLIHMIDMTGGSPTPPVVLAPELGKIQAPRSQDRPRVDRPSFTRDGNFVIARLAGSETQFGVIPTDGSPGRQLSVDLRYRFEGTLVAEANVLWQPDPSVFRYQARDRETGREIVVEVDLTTGDSTVLEADSGSTTFVGSVDPTSVLVHLSSDTMPPDLFLLDETLTRPTRLTRVAPWLSEVQPGPLALLSARVPTPDGSMRDARVAVALPPGWEPGTPLPAIVHVYPGQDMSLRSEDFAAGRVAGVLTQFWTSRGYAVLFPDLSEITPRLQAGNLIRELTDALLPQVHVASNLGYVDPDRLALTGFSFGGYATIGVLTQTGLFRAAVTYASAPLDMMSSWDTGWPQTVARLGDGATPWTSMKQFLTNSPWHQADMITTPVLLIHGAADGNWAEHSESLFRALRSLGKSAQLAVYDGEPHILSQWSRVHSEDVAHRVLEFVSRHLGEKE